MRIVERLCLSRAPRFCTPLFLSFLFGSLRFLASSNYRVVAQRSLAMNVTFYPCFLQYAGFGRTTKVPTQIMVAPEHDFARHFSNLNGTVQIAFNA